ncbi:MAG: MFS transporter [Desulfurococcales archaeon]|nr:MFS transporter [Desulfurococcales archaeon]
MGSGSRAAIVRAALPALAYYYTVGSFGFWLPLYLKSLGWEYRLVTWAASAYFLALTPSTLAAGLLADLTGRPGTLVCLGLLANAVGIEGVVAFHGSPALVYAFRALQGVGLATALPIALGSLSLLAGVRRGVSITALTSSLGMAVGSLAGGAILPALGFPWLVHSAALLSVAAAAASCRWRPPARLPGGRGVLGRLREVPLGVYIVALALVLRNAFASGVFSVLAVVFNMVFGVSILWTSIALAANPLAEFAATPLASRVSRGREALVYSLAIMGTSLVFYLYLHASTAPGVLGAQVLLGVVYIHIMVAGNNYILSRTPEEIRYTASSIYSLSFNLGWIIGTLVAGPYMDAHGPRAWIRLAAIGCVAAGLLALAAGLTDRRPGRGPRGA